MEKDEARPTTGTDHKSPRVPGNTHARKDRWTSGLTESDLRQGGTEWIADGTEGPTVIRFTPHEDYGVMDQHVETGDGQEVHIPLRVIANGDGTEVILTLFRQPGTTDETFARDTK